MTRENATAVVVGAGVVGCAIAHELSTLGLQVLVLERGPRIAEGVTSRNSGVIHAGLYYPPGSLKAEACVEGNRLLYEWCAKRSVPHRKTGKWIVAQADERDELDALLANALNCGATGLSRSDSQQLASAIPDIRAELGVYSSETGIVDPYELSRSLQLEAEANGTDFVFLADVTAIERLSQGGFRISSTRGEIDSEIVVNAAGLYADEIATLAGVDKYHVYPWRGDYFKLKPRVAYSQLIYPVKKKNAPGLGVHLTLGLDGTCRLGPDVALASSKADFATPANLEERQLAFFNAASKYLKGIRVEDLAYDMCGIRPKLRAPEDVAERDFVVSEDLPGFINLVGIESPGLTASLFLARRVASMLA